MSNEIQLLIKEENSPSPAEMKYLDGEMQVDVRELTTRAVIEIRAKEISCYLHTLFLDGRAFQILNVMKSPSGLRLA